MLAEVGDVARFATKDTFASYNGTAPTEVSSGDQIPTACHVRDRRTSHALHMMAITQIRNHGRSSPADDGSELRTPRAGCSALRGSQMPIS
jgi:transposase